MSLDVARENRRMRAMALALVASWRICIVAI